MLRKKEKKKAKKEAYLVQLFEDQIEKNKKKWVFLPVGKVLLEVDKCTKTYTSNC